MIAVAAFRFRLAKILRLRERAEREAAQRFARALAEQEESRRRQAALAEGQRALLAQRDALQRGRLVPALLAQNRWQLLALERSQRREAEQQRALAARAEACRELLVERMREKRLLEKLRERRWEEHVEDERRRERREHDDRPQRRMA